VHADFNRYERFNLDRRMNVFLFLNEVGLYKLNSV
jgi:hypothetical protein